MEHSNYGHLTDCQEVPITFLPQHQDRQPGFEYVMEPRPVSECGKASRKLEGKAALITGGDSGIGRAVAYDFVRQGNKSGSRTTRDGFRFCVSHRRAEDFVRSLSGWRRN